MREPSDGQVNWTQFVSPGSAKAYVVAVALVILATVLRLGLGLVSEEVLPFLTYFPAALFAALLGGLAPGILAAVLGGIIGWWAFMPPPFVFTFLNTGQVISLATYLLSTLLIVWGADHYRRLIKKLENEEKFRKLTVEELAHRLRNKIATIQSIISFQLRDDPNLRDAIIGRLTALSATDDLILQTQGRGAPLREILSAELGPYDPSRVATAGPAVFLPPNLAMTVALLVHELTTNAAKYGALSNTTGQLAISWVHSDGRLNIEWRESGGPIVTTPTKTGFGMRLLSRALAQFNGTRLLSRALAQFNGTVEANFKSTGLICKMNFELATNVSTVEPNNGSAITAVPGVTG